MTVRFYTDDIRVTTPERRDSIVEGPTVQELAPEAFS